MKIDINKFRVRENADVNLKKWATEVEPFYASRAEYKKLLKNQVDLMSEQQRLLYASDKYSLLIIFQAMDAAGKDGAIRHVMSGVNPQGCQVSSFTHPSKVELDHDFLWRTMRCVPERGKIGIFNRSYYEEVLIVRVHPDILRAQNIPDELIDMDKVWKQRFESILDMERHLERNGTKVIKFFLHMSKEEQRKRFIKRIDDPDRNWKFSMADIEERKYWDQYMEAYEDCLSATSTKKAPWYIVPADDKMNARLIISSIIVDTMKSLKMSYPRSDAERIKELQKIKKLL